MEMTIEKVSESLLVSENTEEIQKILSEANSRVNLFNTILETGIERDQLDRITSTPASIENHIEQKLLQANKEYAKLVKAGITAEVRLPENLQSLKRSLEAFAGVRVQTGKYWLLEFDAEANRFKVDPEAAERYFKRQQYRLYVSGEKIKELKTLLTFGEYIDTTAEPGQVFSSKFLNDRYTCDLMQACNALPKAKFMIKASYFRQDRSN